MVNLQKLLFFNNVISDSQVYLLALKNKKHKSFLSHCVFSDDILKAAICTI